ncbi:hypothetical protein EST38_g11083 [Candolleomyces aberdarensis]|uniref:Uncharacterized protein n=1 Tax=Candolleomyces aberdarensis TaxID=2316362 RepID=A0A4Q2D6G1_9AGAR|nr:hypothetical protein EST38_g11083 [Candolleomyces aberdarensis]
MDPTITAFERRNAGPALYDNPGDKVCISKSYTGVDFTVHLGTHAVCVEHYLKKGANWKPPVQWAYTLKLADGTILRGVPEDHLVPV